MTASGTHVTVSRVPLLAGVIAEDHCFWQRRALNAASRLTLPLDTRQRRADSSRAARLSIAAGSLILRDDAPSGAGGKAQVVQPR